MKKGFNLFAYWGKDFGMGKIAEYFYETLKDKFDLKRINVDLPTQSGREYEIKSDKPVYDINIYFINAGGIKRAKSNLPPHYFYNKFEIGVWFWELEEFNPKYFEAFSYLDEIWVFTDFVKKSLEKVSPISVKKLCLPYKIPKVKEKKEGDYFKFLVIFDFFSDFERKNPLGAIKVFRKAFGENKNVRLIIKTLNSKSFPEYIDILKNEAEKSKNIRIIDEFWNREKFYKEMSSSNVYVSLHRGEGLGLNILDSVFLNTIPVITKYGGIVEFLPEDYMFFIPYKIIKAKPVVSAYNFEKARWADPEIDEAVRIIKFIYDNYETALEEKERIRKYIKDKIKSCSLYRNIERILKELRGVSLTKKTIPKKNIYTIFKEVLDGRKTRKILVFYSAPEERVLRVIDSIKKAKGDIKIDLFGRKNRKLIEISDNFIEYSKGGFYYLREINHDLIQRIKVEKYNIIIIPYNNSGEGYENIIEIAMEFNAGVIMGITSNNDINYIKK